MNPVSPAFVIADAHDIYRCGLLNMLKEHFTNCIVAQAADTENLLNAVRQQQYDVIMIDAGLPPLNGLEAARSVIQLNADCRIILYAKAHSEELAVEAFAAGANAFFYTDEPQLRIIFKVSEMLRNGCCITEDIIKAYRAAQQRITLQQDTTKTMTACEKEVLQYIIKGLKNREIAETLHRSIKTVINHRHNIMVKAGCHNTAQLLAYCRAMGWV